MNNNYQNNNFQQNENQNQNQNQNQQAGQGFVMQPSPAAGQQGFQDQQNFQNSAPNPDPNAAPGMNPDGTPAPGKRPEKAPEKDAALAQPHYLRRPDRGTGCRRRVRGDKPRLPAGRPGRRPAGGNPDGGRFLQRNHKRNSPQC